MPLVDEELLQLSRRLLGRANVSPIIPAVRIPGVIQIDQVLDAPVRLMMDVGPEVRRQGQAAKGLKLCRYLMFKIVQAIVAGSPLRRTTLYAHPATDEPALIWVGGVTAGNDTTEVVDDSAMEMQAWVLPGAANSLLEARPMGCTAAGLDTVRPAAPQIIFPGETLNLVHPSSGANALRFYVPFWMYRITPAMDLPVALFAGMPALYKSTWADIGGAVPAEDGTVSTLIDTDKALSQSGV